MQTYLFFWYYMLFLILQHCIPFSSWEEKWGVIVIHRKTVITKRVNKPKKEEAVLCNLIMSQDLLHRSMLDGRLRVGPEVLKPAEEDHDQRGERGH